MADINRRPSTLNHFFIPILCTFLINKLFQLSLQLSTFYLCWPIFPTVKLTTYSLFNQSASSRTTLTIYTELSITRETENAKQQHQKENENKPKKEHTQIKEKVRPTDYSCTLQIPRGRGSDNL